MADDKHDSITQLAQIEERILKTYQVISCQNLFSPENSFLYERCKGRKILIISGPTVSKLYGQKIQAYFNYFFPLQGHVNFLQIKTGEENKNLHTVQEICKAAQDYKIDRQGIFIAIGGGIVLDTVGLAASIYKKSVDYIKINTTLVAQVDVGVGIKAAVNFHESKNEIGTYKFPLLSINDPSFLKTLNDREIRCGLSEMIKMGIILNRQLFEMLEQRFQNIMQHEFDLSKMKQIDCDIISDSITGMAAQLRPNLYETDTKRLVDFGHTLSPQIEMTSVYRYKHGEAVAIDMAISSRIAYLLGKLGLEAFERIIGLLTNIGLPIFDAEICTFDNLWMGVEKTIIRKNGDFNLVIPLDIGHASFIFSISDFDPAILRQAIADMNIISNCKLTL